MKIFKTKDNTIVIGDLINDKNLIGDTVRKLEGICVFSEQTQHLGSFSNWWNYNRFKEVGEVTVDILKAHVRTSDGKRVINFYITSDGDLVVQSTSRDSVWKCYLIIMKGDYKGVISKIDKYQFLYLSLTPINKVKLVSK